jgi:crotonobetainyl-CoA:carnitine CoA-transferase CaiB-like acyl-CoA transferase
MTLNRGKKPVVLDLKKEDDLESMRDRSLSGTSM